MAKGKERAEGSAKAAKTVKSSAARTPGSRPVSARKAPRTELSAEDVYRLIQETAYFKAKARGFEPGREVQDWIEAEAEVRRRLDNRA